MRSAVLRAAGLAFALLGGAAAPHPAWACGCHSGMREAVLVGFGGYRLLLRPYGFHHSRFGHSGHHRFGHHSRLFR